LIDGPQGVWTIVAVSTEIMHYHEFWKKIILDAIAPYTFDDYNLTEAVKEVDELPMATLTFTDKLSGKSFDVGPLAADADEKDIKQAVRSAHVTFRKQNPSSTGA
jgi:hypothetical protein